MVTHDFPNMAPSVCFLCEAAEQGAVFVDTMRDFGGTPFTPLAGRKYVCSYCITDLAHHIGVFNDERARLNEKIDSLNEVVKVAEDRLAVRDEIHAAVEKGLAIGLIKPDAPAPRKRKPAETEAE